MFLLQNLSKWNERPGAPCDKPEYKLLIQPKFHPLVLLVVLLVVHGLILFSLAIIETQAHVFLSTYIMNCCDVAQKLVLFNAELISRSRKRKYKNHISEQEERKESRGLNLEKPFCWTRSNAIQGSTEEKNSFLPYMRSRK